MQSPNLRRMCEASVDLVGFQNGLFHFALQSVAQDAGPRLLSPALFISVLLVGIY